MSQFPFRGSRGTRKNRTSYSYRRRRPHQLPPQLLSRILDRETPSLLLQAIIVPGERTDDGIIIEAIAPAWNQILKTIASDPEFRFKLDSRQMEEFLAAEYKKRGFNVVLTRRSGDLGRDVIAEKRGEFSLRIIDQVKAHRPGHLVTANDVRALGFVMLADEQATKGIVTTTSDFAPRIMEDDFIKKYVPYRLELVNGSDLVTRLSQIR